ncbi:MAG: hypothetical protein HC781_13540 [Leptolyngbyaceae cyanobacterium CSU_1_4]|nr:hypothetical protein [Leptolyngbyaceae cyanobacterium CSU_1_4]
MANKKNESGTLPKAVPAVPPLNQEQIDQGQIDPGQSPKSPETQVAVATPAPVAVEKIEKGKKAQAAKKGTKELQTTLKELTPEPSKVPTAMQATAPLEATVNDEEAKDKKGKEAKVKKHVSLEPVAAEAVPVSKKGASEPASEKATKMKRLTLDIAKPLHKAIKAKAVEEGVPMVDMLRSLLEEHYSK